MTIAWVIGSNGLLGSAIERTLRKAGIRIFSLPYRFCWFDEALLSQQLQQAAATFADNAGNSNDWELYWAAGTGTMNSQVESLQQETRALTALLDTLESESRLMAKPGAIGFASSAGGVYAGVASSPITEATLEAPISAYGREKLRQEELFRSFSARHKQLTVLLARITTLYGPGQSYGKRQGLLAHIARCILRKEIVRIYVPYDTIRDYISADCAAERIVRSLRNIPRLQPKNVFIKIIASESPITIAGILAIFRRVTRQKFRTASVVNELTPLYHRRHIYRSVVSFSDKEKPAEDIATGISRIMAAEHCEFIKARKKPFLQA